ncbi:MULTISPECIES: circadian clock KaiB family protein [unclassified Luteimonas]|uniref:circadian clock KaiB family protein n=1 Tax=unclassified Luteimonas TaxID=2629088 RepID=UPI001600B973|nr:MULTISPECIES: circadian clock KaiB family protein [unclassified Luteimonas]MBB1473825.1 circadian clock protein KaiB [Luteimonas sp. MC1782]MBB6599943.1 circadian clock protein KaiB [Luteimonas sp. MC1825]QOC87651.1 circadian clock KaiB family protein [Luteimonas sp. MC1825]
MDTAHFKFQLFVAENAANSVQALANLRAICRAHLPGRHEIEVVDVFVQPTRALAERIFMTPTLVILQPGAVRRVVGNLSETATVLQTLGLESSA